MPTFYEFFAGGGMARAGLGERWECLLANDNDGKKAASYAMNWGKEHLKVKSVGALTAADPAGHADLAWASFPCQDLSLAGSYAGLKGERSGTFWLFWKFVQLLAKEGREPSLIVLENVRGALTSHGGKDFAAIGAALANGGYRFGAMVIDAVHFLPQSRPRLFIVAVRSGREVPEGLTVLAPNADWHLGSLVKTYQSLPTELSRAWIWWRLPPPPARKKRLSDIIEDAPVGVEWHCTGETERLLSLMSPLHRRKVENAKRMRRRMVGGVYRRTRVDEEGRRAQRAEVRFDGIAGCLRTPAGGSSRQSILVVEGERVRSRLLAPREAARLMGLPESYKLPENYNEAYHLAGDGVAVPVVRFLAANLLEPLLGGDATRTQEAA